MSSAADHIDVSQLNTAIISVLADYDAFREENEYLKSSLATTLRRAERAESLLTISQDDVPQALSEMQSRLDSEQAAHHATRAHLRTLQEQWEELDRYTGLIDVRMADARSIFANFLSKSLLSGPPSRTPSLNTLQEARMRSSTPHTTTLPPYRQHMETLQDLPSARQRSDSLSNPAAFRSPPPAARQIQSSYSVYPAGAPSMGSSASGGGPLRSRSMSVEDMLLDAAEISGPRRRTGSSSATPRRPRAFNGRMMGSAGPSRLISRGRLMDDRSKRICRHCGLPGRQKDGRCVEKWGPGPDGPGTVCDRCRKKIKRVEKRETAHAYQLPASSTTTMRSVTSSPERRAVLSEHASLVGASGGPQTSVNDDLMDAVEATDDGEDELLEAADLAQVSLATA